MNSPVFVFLDYGLVMATPQVIEATQIPVTSSIFTKIEDKYLGLFSPENSVSV